MGRSQTLTTLGQSPLLLQCIFSGHCWWVTSLGQGPTLFDSLQRTSVLVAGNHPNSLPDCHSQPSTAKQLCIHSAPPFWKESSLVTSSVSLCRSWTTFFPKGTRTLPFSYAGTVSIFPGPEEQPRITTCSAEHSQCSWPNIRHFFSWLTDAFGFNYFDGNFRFASMCGKSDFPQPNGMLNSLSKRVPQYLVPHFLPGRGFRVLTLGFGGGWGN